MTDIIIYDTNEMKWASRGPRNGQVWGPEMGKLGAPKWASWGPLNGQDGGPKMGDLGALIWASWEPCHGYVRGPEMGKLGALKWASWEQGNKYCWQNFFVIGGPGKKKFGQMKKNFVCK